MTVVERTVDLSIYLIGKPVQIHVVIFAVTDEGGEEQTPEQEVWIGGTLTGYALTTEAVSFTLEAEAEPLVITAEGGTYTIRTLGESNG